MPTVLEWRGFRAVVHLPPREHEPPHVHVWKHGGETVIELASGARSQRIRSVSRMRTADVITAFRLVEAHTVYLLERWRKYHG